MSNPSRPVQAGEDSTLDNVPAFDSLGRGYGPLTEQVSEGQRGEQREERHERRVIAWLAQEEEGMDELEVDDRKWNDPRPPPGP